MHSGFPREPHPRETLQSFGPFPFPHDPGRHPLVSAAQPAGRILVVYGYWGWPRQDNVDLVELAGMVTRRHVAVRCIQPLCHHARSPKALKNHSDRASAPQQERLLTITPGFLLPTP